MQVSGHMSNISPPLLTEIHLPAAASGSLLELQIEASENQDKIFSRCLEAVLK